MKLEIEKDRLSGDELKELEAFGCIKVDIERFMDITELKCAAIGRLVGRSKQVMHHHKKKGNVIKFTPKTGGIELMNKQGVIA